MSRRPVTLGMLDVLALLHLPVHMLCPTSAPARRLKQPERVGPHLTKDLQQVCGLAASPAWWSLRCLISPLAKSTSTRKSDLLSGRSEIWKTKSCYPSWDHKLTFWVTILRLQHPTTLTWLVCTNKSDGTVNFLRDLPLFLPPKIFFTEQFFFPHIQLLTQKRPPCASKPELISLHFAQLTLNSFA